MLTDGVMRSVLPSLQEVVFPEVPRLHVDLALVQLAHQDIVRRRGWGWARRFTASPHHGLLEGMSRLQIQLEQGLNLLEPQSKQRRFYVKASFDSELGLVLTTKLER